MVSVSSSGAWSGGYGVRCLRYISTRLGCLNKNSSSSAGLLHLSSTLLPFCRFGRAAQHRFPAETEPYPVSAASATASFGFFQERGQLPFPDLRLSGLLELRRSSRQEAHRCTVVREGSESGTGSSRKRSIAGHELSRLELSRLEPGSLAALGFIASLRTHPSLDVGQAWCQTESHFHLRFYCATLHLLIYQISLILRSA